MTQQTFLVEIGTEELPPKSLRILTQSFTENFTTELDNADISHGEISWFATPRRLALKVADLSTFQPDHEIKKLGPTILAAFGPDGQPTKAAVSWARSVGITIDKAKHFRTDKGICFLCHHEKIKGRAVSELLLEMVRRSLVKLPIPKLMRWGDKNIYFVRPVHTIILLLDKNVIEGTVLGMKSGRTIRGHRFMGEPEFILENADQYPTILYKRGKVIANYEERKAIIKKEIEKSALSLGGKADITNTLLEEVTSLVEWPVVLSAKFEKKFLAVPAEALVYTMKKDQKYFPVYDKSNNLMSDFIFVANTESSDPQQIITGNEKVIRSRFSDAEFFFKTDCKQKLEDNLPRLETVLFQQKLGTLRDKTDRLEALSGWFASKIGANVIYAKRAGLLAKCDLVSNMVFEFPDTQGVMGMYYARHDNESEDVALALKEQYQPRFSGDDLPSTKVSAALALAEKMDTLVGMFGIGQYPTGNKDPFALRRIALGVLRIIIQHHYQLNLIEITEEAVRLYDYKLTKKNIVNNVVDFMLSRFRSWYQEIGYSTDTIQAVLACRPTSPTDCDARIKALTHFRTLKNAEALSTANKRVSNILKKSHETLKNKVLVSALKVPEEIILATHLFTLQEKLQPMFSEGKYQDALIELASLHEVLDAFFINIIVMDQNQTVRINRLTLLNQLRELFLKIADLSLLQ
ncbi:glycine--tRNA ligase subunit beta [Candidatus Hartigia pinicola]